MKSTLSRFSFSLTLSAALLSPLAVSAETFSFPPHTLTLPDGYELELAASPPLVQPFSHVEEPLPEDIPQLETGRTKSGVSLASLRQQEQVPEDLLTGNMRVDYNCNSGLAWAARRDILDEDGFYDACIMGSGNRAMLCAAMGQIETGIKALKMTPQWAYHYSAWANEHYRKIQGDIGYIPGTVVHHWHGDLKNRKYQSRHQDFSQFDFDPTRDITYDDNGIWQWNSDKPDMHRYAAQYFKDRKEDTCAEK